MHTRNYFLSLHDALPISSALSEATGREIRFAVTVDESLMLDDEDEDPQPSSGVTSSVTQRDAHDVDSDVDRSGRSEEHTSELQSRGQLVCRHLLEKETVVS